jgi:hypothetical protein
VKRPASPLRISLLLPLRTSTSSQRASPILTLKCQSVAHGSGGGWPPTALPLACLWPGVAVACRLVPPGWNKAGHPLPCGKSSATFLTCVFSSQHFSSYPASSRSDVPSLCPASITSRYDVWSMPGPQARASSSRTVAQSAGLRTLTPPATDRPGDASIRDGCRLTALQAVHRTSLNWGWTNVNSGLVHVCSPLEA